MNKFTFLKVQLDYLKTFKKHLELNSGTEGFKNLNDISINSRLGGNIQEVVWRVGEDNWFVLKAELKNGEIKFMISKDGLDQTAWMDFVEMSQYLF